MVISNGKEDLSLIGIKWPPTTANSGDRQREKGEDAVEQFHTKKDQVSQWRTHQSTNKRRTIYQPKLKQINSTDYITRDNPILSIRTINILFLVKMTYNVMF